MWQFLTSEPGIRLGFFGGVLAAMAVWEVLAPRRPWTVSKLARWVSNLGLVLLNSVLLRLIAPLGLVSVAALAETRGWGLFHNLTAPSWLIVTAGVVLLDLAIYLQHVMLHAVPLLWRLHMVHHADLDFDVTTGVRFHTLEILLSLGIKGAVILLLGTPPVSVLIFEVLLNATSMFNHGNVRMPAWLDRVLRWFVVTPEMHRVHHSIVPCSCTLLAASRRGETCSGYTVTSVAHLSASSFKSATVFGRHTQHAPRHTFQPAFTNLHELSCNDHAICHLAA